MGTEVCASMPLPGCYSLRNLNGNTGNVVWPLHHESRNSGQYSDLFLARLTKGNDNKEQMRQTILKHDSIFRHQLHELHRLYRIQRDMMNEIKSEEGYKHLITKDSSQSNPFSSGFMSEHEQRRWQASKSHFLDFSCFKQSMSGAHSIQSHLSPLKRNVVLPGCCLTENELKLENCETMESDCHNIQTRLFDLECPAEEYINSEEVCRGVSAVPRFESFNFKRSDNVPTERDGNSSRPCNSNNCCKDGATVFNINLKQTCGFTDLNESILVEEASNSTHVGIPGNITCSEEEVQRMTLSSSASHSHLRFHQWAAESCQESNKTREAGISLNNLHFQSERRQNGWFSNKFENNGQTRCNGSLLLEDLHAPFNSLHVETAAAQSAIFLLSDQNKGETFKKQKLFGVEIPEKNNGAAAVASHALESLPVHSWSAAANSGIPSCSSQTKCFGNLSQSLLGNPCSTNSFQLIDTNSKFLPSLRAEETPISDFNLCCSSNYKESCAPVGLCNKNDIRDRQYFSKKSNQPDAKFSFKPLPWMLETKSAVDLNVDAKDVDKNQNKEKFLFSFVSDNGSIIQSSDGGLSWLKATIPCNVEPIKEVECTYQMNSPSWQSCSRQFVDRTTTIIQNSLSATCVGDGKHGKSDASHSSTSTKLLGFSISENVCRDLPPPNSPSKLGSPASEIDGAPPLKCEEECLVEGLVEVKSLVGPNTDVRHIDLNLCVEEGIEGEDVQLTYSSIRTNVSAGKIDLEKPVTIEMGMKITSDSESLQSNATEPSNLLHADIGEPQGPLSVSAAAEALIAISSTCMMSLQRNAGSLESEKSAIDSLNWFADIITCCLNDTENDVGSVGACLLDSIPDGIDMFEYMTLNLTETKIEECSYIPQVEENKKGKETTSRRPRRGQARRGRQRKDFQREILPSLTSLSRNEVTEDFQMIEGIIRATGGDWQSSLTQKNNAKSSVGRGRKRAGGAAPPTTIKDCSNQSQQMNTGLEERSLTGWGKRTRRPPRQRCLISSPLL